MNKTITSKEAILEKAKLIVKECGIEGLNIRKVAKKCNISIGSIYNYFPTKSDLIIETIKFIWMDIMHNYKDINKNSSFVEVLKTLYLNIKEGSNNYPYFFKNHSLAIANDDKPKGKNTMDLFFVHIKESLILTLENDNDIKEGVFNDLFTKVDFVDFIFNNLILLISNNQSFDFLSELTTKLLYRN